MIPEEELTGSYCRFMKNAGLLQWDLREHKPSKNVQLGATYAALADIEEDSRFMQVKIKQAGLHRRAPLRDFNIQWLCEEQEHATALRTMAKLRGASIMPREHDLGARDKRSIAAVVGLNILKLAETEVMTAYMTLGTIQEFFAITTYRHMANTVGSPEEASILTMLARQEGRHMRFFHEGANLLLRGNPPRTAAVVRFIFRNFWRPPGTDLLGADAWQACFGGMLNDPHFRQRLRKGDDIICAMPGLQELAIIENFLSRHPSSTMVE
ncbi:MAG TPA: hypothetical protein PKC31_00850 [Candidatus Nanoperiomorbaceae bacterium]|nr:hypothetical protein [Candidatus Nanoperiomorbaceae bacterium]